MSEQLPKGWVTVELQDCADINLGQSPPSSSYNEHGKGIPFFQGKTDFGNLYPEVRTWCSKPSKIAKKDDILISVRAPVGPTNLSPSTVCIGRGLSAICPKGNIETKYLLYLFRRFESEISVKGTGTTFKAISGDVLRRLNFPIAPLNEQKRIVAKIEELFSNLDAGVKALEKAKELLKQYRQSVLKAAVTGELTKKWREKNKEKLEPASKLLDRILKERRKKWEEAQLAEFKRKGTTPKDDKWKEKYDDPSSPEDATLGEIPAEWILATIDQLQLLTQYGSSSKTNENDKGIPVLRMGNIYEGGLLLENLKYLPKTHSEFPELLLEDGDLLFNRTNSAELVGKSAVYMGTPAPCSFASYLIRVRFCEAINPHFVGFYLNSVYGKAWIKSVVSQQVGQANVNGTKLKALSIPLPSSEEQKAIVDKVRRRIEAINRVELELDEELIRSLNLRQSILKKAFEGKLLPQDSKDEPASELLKRIQAERLANVVQKTKPRKT